MRILFSKDTVTEVPCPCGCSEMFKPTSLKHLYKTAGCANRAKLAGQKRRRDAKNSRKSK
jgi:hypothetical protein